MSKYTEEQKQEWKSKLQGLAAKVRAMSQEEKTALATRCGTLTAEGRTLSVYNTCFLWSQAGEALAQIGGFKQWQKVGRKVRQGEHAKGYIYVPLGRVPGDTFNSSDLIGTKEIETSEHIRFRLVPVFDVTQTETMGGN